MSIEEMLKENIVALREHTAAIRELMASWPSASCGVTEAKAAKPAKAAKQVEVVSPPADTPTVESLQALCMSIVRADLAKKAAIVSALAVYGAKVVSEVPKGKLVELEVVLKALV